MTKINAQTGVSMIEVLVTTVVIAIGLLGVAVSQSVAVKETGNSAQTTAAVNTMNDLIERMRINRDGIENYRVAINGTCPNPAPKVCGTSVSDKQVVDGETCTSQEKAQFDYWDVFCDKDNRDEKKGKSGNNDYLASAELSMTCLVTKEGSQKVNGTDDLVGTARAGGAGDPCKDIDEVKLELTWQESRNKRKRDPASNPNSNMLNKKIITRTAL